MRPRSAPPSGLDLTSPAALSLVTRLHEVSLVGEISRELMRRPAAGLPDGLAHSLMLLVEGFEFEAAAVTGGTALGPPLAYAAGGTGAGAALTSALTEWLLGQVPTEEVSGELQGPPGSRHPVLAVPLTTGDEALGMLGVAGPLGDEDQWAQVRRVAELLAGALARHLADRALREQLSEVARLKQALERERDYLREELREGRGFDAIVGRSPALAAVLAAIDSVASTHAAVLVRGESGVGKELVARALHERSPRASGPLVKVNCAAIPRDLFESEFFGHVRGAFTGAQKDRVGRFELAEGGTLFLDEVGEIPLDLQSKLLRVLQEGEYERVGDDRTRRVDVRIVSATNRDLLAECAAGRFRKDLYYRLAVFPIEVPPLRDRPEDIVPLAEHFLARHARALGRPLALSAAHRAVLERYAWPGNVRELSHVLERAAISSPRGELRLEAALPGLESAASRAAAAPRDRRSSPPGPVGGILTRTELDALERESLAAALAASGARVAGPGGAAERVGMRPSTFRDRARALGLTLPARSGRAR